MHFGNKDDFGGLSFFSSHKVGKKKIGDDKIKSCNEYDLIDLRFKKWIIPIYTHSHTYTHIRSHESFHLARAHTLTHSHTFVHASRVLPDGLLPEQELRNKGLFQTANFKVKQRGTEILFHVNACLPAFDSTHRV